MTPTFPSLLLVSVCVALSFASCAANERPGALSSDAAGDLPPLDHISPFTDAAATPDALADAAPIDDPQGADGPAALYPPGPYGNAVGQTLADMRFEGFVNTDARDLASERPYENTSMGVLRGAGRGYALVFISEFL